MREKITISAQVPYRQYERIIQTAKARGYVLRGRRANVSETVRELLSAALDADNVEDGSDDSEEG